MRRILLLAFAAIVLAAPATTLAGGLYVSDFGTPTQGTAGAGAGARAEDASAALHGPAGMTYLDSHQLTLSAAPGFSDIHFDPADDSPTAGGDGGQQGGFIPILSGQYVHELSERWRFGTSLLSISGSVLDPSDAWTGRNEITELSLFTLTVFPSLAYRVSDWLSIGAGPAFTYGVLNWELQAPGPFGQAIELDDVDDFAVSGAAHVLLEPLEDVRLSVLYQSETEFDLSGDVNLPAGVTAGIDLELKLAQAVRVGIAWQPTAELRLLGGFAWEDWSTIGNLPVSVAGGGANVSLGFDDTWKGSIGIEYRVAEPWVLQAGFTYDSSALDTKDRTVALPIDRQLRWAVGALYDYSESTCIGLSFIWIDLGRARVDTQFVRGDYENNDVFLFGVNVSWKRLPWNDRLSL